MKHVAELVSFGLQVNMERRGRHLEPRDFHESLEKVHFERLRLKAKTLRLHRNLMPRKLSEDVQLIDVRNSFEQRAGNSNVLLFGRFIFGTFMKLVLKDTLFLHHHIAKK